MSHRLHLKRKLATPVTSRRDVLTAAITPLLEMLEQRRHMSTSPVANPGGPYNLNEGQSVVISGLASTDADGTIATYQWDTNYSVGRGFRSRFTGPNWTFTADNSGTRTIALKVTDNAGDTNIQTATINIADVAPTITLTAPTTADEASLVNVSWSYTDPGVSDTVTAWEVDWGDDTTTTVAGNVSASSHRYAEDGNYVITLTATQTDGQTSVTSNITVNQVTPIVVATTTTPEIDEGEMVQIDFSSTNRQNSIEGWVIEWGDGSVDLLSPTRSHATHFYTDSGNYAAVVSAQEPDGGAGTATVNYVVNNVAADVTITGVPSTGNEGSSITVGSTVSDAGQDDTHVYGWTVYKDGVNFPLPGGTVDNGTGFTFTPTDNGSYVIRLTVVDDEGASRTVNSSAITVGNVDPTATISGEPVGSINEGTAVTLTASPADISDDDTSAGFDYAWSVAKGGSAYTLPGGTVTDAASFTFTPEDNGTYVATVIVTDQDGGTVSVSSTSITVDNVAPVAGILNAPASGSIDEGDHVNVSADVTDAADDTHTYAWSITKDGNPYNLGSIAVDESSLHFRPVDNGVYVISLTVTDDDGDSDTVSTASITVNNAAPTGTVTGDSTADEASAVNYSVTVSDAGEDDTHSYLWSVTKGGNAVDLTGLTVNQSTFSFTPDDNEAYVVSVQVTDNDGDSTTLTHNLAVANVDPTAAITGAPSQSPEGTAIVLGSTAADVGDDTLSYAWSVEKDGNAVDLTGLTVDQSTFSFTPDDNGSFEFFLTVTDEDGGTVTTSAVVAVTNEQPSAGITGEPVAPVGEGATISLTGSVTDAGTADTHSWSWTITKDGNPWTPPVNTVLNTSSLTFVAVDNGTYVATATVTDDDAGDTQVSSQPIIVTNTAPVASITGAPSGGDEGTAITVGSTVTDDGIADTHSYAWSVTKDGNAVDLTGVTTNAASFTFTPADDGAYVISLTVTDNDGDDNTTTTSFTIDNVAPAPVITGNATVNEGTPITLNVAANDAGVDDAQTYLWSVTKDGNPYDITGITANASSFTFSPNLHGAYVVSVTVTDDSGDSNTATHNIAVASVAPTVTITGVPSGPRGEGTPVTLGSTVTDVPAESGFTRLWSVTRNGVTFPLPGGTVTNGTTFEFTPTDNGTYRVTLAVTDSGNATGTSTTGNIIITNALPDAILTGEPGGPITEGTAVNLSVNAQDPGAEDTLTYAWSVKKNGSAWTLPGGTVTNGTTFSFTPTDNGTYIATVAIVDDDGGPISVNSTAITVTNVAPTASISAPLNSVAEGNLVSASSTVADVGTADTHTYAWSVTKDGQPYTLPISVVTTGSSLNFTPTDNGSYVLGLTVTDDDGGSVTATSSTITVTNVNPDATIDGPATAIEGDTVSYSVEAIDPGSDDTLTYAWSVTKDGNAVDLSSVVTDEASFSFVPVDNGAYVVSVTVTDDDAGTITETANLAVANADPIVTIVDAPTSGTEGSPLTFDSSVTDAGTLDTFTYAWSVTKDGQAYDLTGVTVDGTQFAFTPNDNGSYVVSLTVTDDDSGTSTVSTAAIIVANEPPTATINGAPSTAISEGDYITLDVTVEDEGALDTAFTYAWSVTKDGAAYDLAGVDTTTDALAFATSDNGLYVVSVVVTDKDSGSTTVSTTGITVENVAPQAIINVAPTGGEEGSEAFAAALASDAGSADTLSYLWTVTKDGNAFSLPDGVNATESSFAFVPTDNGEYVISLTVVDDDLASITVSSDPFTVTNVNPNGSISGPAEANEGDTVTLTANPTDAGALDTEFTYEWSVERVGDVQVSSPDNNQGASFDFTPTDDGEYLVSVIVTDKDGGSSTFTHTINVFNVEPTVAIVDVPSTGTEGTEITGSSNVSDPGNDDLTYGWTVYRNGSHFMLPDGTEITGQSLTFTPTDDGSYVMRLTVLDGDGGSTTSNSSPVVVSNAAPEVAITGDTEVAEGSTLELGSEVTDAGADDLDSLAYAWTVKRGTTTITTGSTADFDFTPTVHGTYVVTLVVTDKDGSATTTQSTITVTNVAPSEAAISGLPESMDESQIATLIGSADDVEGDTLTYAWNVLRNGSQYATYEGEEFAFDPHARGNYQITLTVTDSDGATDTATDSIVVTNVAPTGTFSGPTSPVLLGKTANFTLSIADVPPTQALTVLWNFGDGNTATGAYLGSQSGITRSYTYAAPGTYSATITVSDGVDSTVLSRTVVVSPAGLAVDAFDSSKTGLFVYGSNANDVISVAPTTNGNYGVTMNGVSLGSAFAPTGKVYIYGNGGANNITVDGQIDAVVFAGSSTASNVTTGNGNDIIVGTSAADRLNGRAGRDIVIGAAGADTLYGGDSEDLLVAQGTNWMTSISSLKSVKSKWDLGSQDIATRRTNIKATGLFNTTALIADAGGNNLYGEQKADWLVHNTATDRLRDYQAALDLLN